MPNYIPVFIEKHLAERNGFFKGISVHIDICNFTGLTEKFMHEEKEGAEKISRILNIFFNPIVDSIYFNGGFISNIAGDAITAIFDEENYFGVFACLKEVKEIQGLLQLYEAHIRIGVASGDIEWGIPGSESRKVFYFRGDAIEKSSIAENICGMDEICFDDSCDYFFKFIDSPIYKIPKGNKYYYIIKNLICEMTSFSNYGVTYTSEETDRLFYPRNIINRKIYNEFRKVVSIFISFNPKLNYEELNELIKAIIKEIKKSGGYFNSLDFGDKGGYILVNFGAPIAYENNLERACDFTIEVIRKYSQIYGLSAGMDYGSTFSGILGNEKRRYFSCIGNVTNHASRLMLKAKIGEIMVSETIYEKIRLNYELKHYGKELLKGFEKAENIYCLKEKKMETIESFFYGKFIDRLEEIKNARNEIKKVMEFNEERVICVYGEKGTGKSRFLFEVFKSDKFLNIWRNYLKPDGSFSSYAPFKFHFKMIFGKVKEEFEANFNEFLYHLYSHSIINDRMFEKFLEKKDIYAGLCDILVLNNNIDGKSIKELIEDAVVFYFELVCMLYPVALIIENVDNMDEDSKELITSLLRRMKNQRIVFLFSSLANIIDEYYLKEAQNITNIELTPFDKNTTKEFFETLFSSKISEKMMDILYEKTSGIPFYIEEYYRYINEYRLVMYDKENEIDINEKKLLEIPSNINSIIISRMDKLDYEFKEFMLIASVIGINFDLRVIKKIMDKDDMDKFVETGEKLKFIQKIKNNNCIFRNSLIREIIYSMQFKSKIQSLHLQVAEIIKEIYPERPDKLKEIAYHYELAEEKNKCVEYYSQAAEYAKRFYRYNESLYYLDRLTPMVSKDTLINIYKKRGEIFLSTGSYDEAFEVYKEALKLYSGSIFEIPCGILYMKLGFCYYSLNNDEMAVIHYDKAVKIFLENKYEEGLTEIYGNLGNLYRGQSEYQKAEKYFDMQIELAEKNQYKKFLAIGFAGLGNLFWESGNNNKSEGYFIKALEIAKEMDSKRQIAAYTSNLGNIYYSRNEIHKAKESYEFYLKVSNELGYKKGISIATGNLAYVYMELGKYDEGIESARKKAVITKEMNDIKAMSLAFEAEGIINYYKKDYKEAIKHLNKAVEIQRLYKMKLYEAMSSYYISSCYYEMEDYNTADAYITRSIEIAVAINYFEYFASYNILNLKIQAKRNCVNLLKEYLIVIIEDFDDENERAQAFYELWCMTGEEKYASNSLRLLEKLYEKSGKVIYQDIMNKILEKK